MIQSPGSHHDTFLRMSWEAGALAGLVSQRICSLLHGVSLTCLQKQMLLNLHLPQVEERERGGLALTLLTLPSVLN